MARNEKKRLINKADAVDSIFFMLRKEYLYAFLKQVKDYLSLDDLSDTVNYVWCHGKKPNSDEAISISEPEFVDIFKSCNPEILMSEDDYNYFKNLPEELTIYRGFVFHNEKCIYGMSWTLSLERAIWFSNRFHNWFQSMTGREHKAERAVYEAKIKKEDVLAYFDGRKEAEIVVNPEKLYDVKPYEEKHPAKKHPKKKKRK